MNSELDVPGIENANIVGRDMHTISRKNISRSALKVLYRLSGAGFNAYIVGGGVRDLLLEKKPKDFDVATNATPKEIKYLLPTKNTIGIEMPQMKSINIDTKLDYLMAKELSKHNDI